MPLERQNWQHPFAKGVDTLTDAKSVMPPSLSRLENAVMTTPGVLKKRNGYETLNAVDLDGAPLGEVIALGKFQEELLAFNGRSLLSYSPENEAWADQGPARSVGVATEFVTGGTTTVAACGVSADDAHRATVYERAGSIYVTLQDLQTGAVVRADERLSAGSAPQACVFVLEGTPRVVVCYLDAGWLWSQYWDGAGWTAREARAQTDCYATVLDDSLEYVHLAWADTAASTVYFGLFVPNETGMNTTSDLDPGATGPRTGITSISCHWIPEPIGSEVAYVAATDGTTTGVYWWVSDGIKAMTTTAASSGDKVAVVPVNIDVGYVVTERQGTSTSLNIVPFYPDYGGGLSVTLGTATSGWQRNAAIAAQPFAQGGDWYLPIFVESLVGLQNGFYLMDVETRHITAKAAYTMGVGPSGGTLPFCQEVDDTVIMPVLLRGRLNSVAVTSLGIGLFSNAASGVTTWDFAPDFRCQSAELGRNLSVSGGFVQSFDGRTTFEHGFFMFPEGVQATPYAAGSTLEAGTYQYKAMYEWSDSQGQIHRSATSPTVTVTAAAGDAVAVIVPTLRVTNRAPAEVAIVLYRTEVNGTVFYRTGTPATATANDATNDTVTINDTTGDDTLATYELCYINGGELDNDPPPNCRLLMAAKNRLWAVDEFGDLWHSKEYITGEAVGWSLALKKSIPRDGGEILALGTLDDKILVFKRTKTFFFAGDGPTPAGQQDTFTGAAELPFKLGCSNQNSIVEYDYGLFFESGRGLWVLDRGLSARPVGANIGGYSTQTINGAIHRTDLDQVWFVTQDGPVLVYDYTDQTRADDPGQWMTFTGLAANDVVVFNDMAVLAKVGRGVWQESADLYTDDGEYYSMLVETCWITLAGQAGWKRVYEAEILGELRSPHTLNIDCLFDYIDTPVQYSFDTAEALPEAQYGDAATYGSDSIYGGEADNLYHFRVQPSRQECIAVKYRVWDSGQSGTGQSMDLSCVVLDVGIKQGLSRIREGKST